MKKFLITTVFLCTCSIAKSQDLTYTPFFRDTPRQNQQEYQPQRQRQRQRLQPQPQQQTQRLRATAYQVDNNGNYTKIPIQVMVSTYIHPTGDTSQEVKVTSYYRNNSYGGQWENCIYRTPVQRCQSIYGNEMEQSFMFKADLPMIGWVYFDL